MDYHIRSSDAGAVREPEFTLQLQTLSPDGSQGQIQFACDVVKLEQLLQRVREAEKQVERLSATLAAEAK